MNDKPKPPSRKTGVYSDDTLIIQTEFLRHFVETKKASTAAGFTNVNMQIVYQWRASNQVDPQTGLTFRERERMAVEEIRDEIRGALFDRGLNGVQERVIYQGEVVYESRS